MSLFCGNFYQLFGQLILFGIIVWLLWKLIVILWTSWIAPYFGFGITWKGKNSWAIVTGASDGIGLEFARQLALKGYNVLIISRNEENLRRAKQAIEMQVSQCGEIRILAADLSKTDIFPQIREAFSELNDIDVLINNCGLSYRYPEYFTEIPYGETVVHNIMHVNVVATTMLCQMVLPKMVARKRGIIINLSSIAAIIPTPLLAVYSATKVYIDYFTQALNLEYRNKGVVIQSLLPGYVTTEMSQIQKTSWMVPSASKYVKNSLKTVGIEDRTMGYWAHKLLVLIQEIVGKRINIFFTHYWVKSVRRRYYNKIARQQMTRNASNAKINNNDNGPSINEFANDAFQ